jgi:hypothetical protein
LIRFQSWWPFFSSSFKASNQSADLGQSVGQPSKIGVDTSLPSAVNDASKNVTNVELFTKRVGSVSSTSQSIFNFDGVAKVLSNVPENVADDLKVAEVENSDVVGNEPKKHRLSIDYDDR